MFRTRDPLLLRAAVSSLWSVWNSCASVSGTLGRAGDAFYDLHDLAITLREETHTWFDMDETQKAMIVGLAEGDTKMKSYAEAVLALIGDTSLTRIPEQFDLPSERRGEEEVPEAPVQAMDQRIVVYPNPFNNNFNLDYSFADEAQEVTIEVFDLVGRNVKTMQLRQVQNGKVIIELGECLGIYLLRMFADGKQVHQQKMVCLKP